MKKVSLQSLVSFIDSIDAPQEVKDIRDEIVAELDKGQAKADANRTLYAEMRKQVMETLRTANAPVTAQEIADATGLSRGKIVWGLTHEWADEICKVQGKVNTYTLA